MQTKLTPPGRSRSKADDVYLWLRDEIGSGQIRPGDRINADQISRDLFVSKIPVREAIGRLAAEGVVSVLRNSGAVVAPLSWKELADIQQCRLLLEPAAAQFATMRVNDQAVADLLSTIAETRHWAQSGEGDVFDLNRRFHLTLISLAENDVLTHTLDLVLQRVSRYRMLAKHTPASARSTADEHTAIVEALVAGDAPKLQGLLRDHLESPHNVASTARGVDPAYFNDSLTFGCQGPSSALLQA